MSETPVFTRRKPTGPIPEVTPDEQATYSARYILEEIRENGDKGIESLAEFLGYPEGVIAEALNNIFYSGHLAKPPTP
jgi:hypothetical protein